MASKHYTLKHIAHEQQGPVITLNDLPDVSGHTIVHGLAIFTWQANKPACAIHYPPVISCAFVHLEKEVPVNAQERFLFLSMSLLITLTLQQPPGAGRPFSPAR